jgi:hypothetical protein
MPGGLSVYEPRVTFDGTTTTLTYNVAVSSWPDQEGLTYTAQKTVAAVANADPQSIEALILHYGATDRLLFGSTAITSTTVGKEEKLATTKGVGDSEVALPHYVIIPLDTSLIKEYLTKGLPIGVEAEKTPLVWIEENPAIGKVETVTTTDNANWKDGTYEESGLRIIGLAKSDSSVEIAGTVDNFDDGKAVGTGESPPTRLPSIATVLADDSDRNGRYTSTINFYISTCAKTIQANVTPSGDDPSTSEWKGTADVEQWMKTEKPVFRVVYRWAD